MKYMIQTKNLNKSYKKQEVNKDISLLPYIEPFLNSTKAGERKAAARAVKQITNLRIQ